MATCAEFPLLDEEWSPLRRAFLEVGVSGEPVVWDDPAVGWSAYDLVVIRATWDYPSRRTEFLEWTEEVTGTTILANSPKVARWNTDKHYLSELGDADLRIVPTSYFGADDDIDFPDSPTGFVVKPAISVGSQGADLYGMGKKDRAVRHAEALRVKGHTAMIQSYLRSVDEKGETTLFYFDGAFSHAVRKGPLLRRGASVVEGLFAEEEIRP